MEYNLEEMVREEINETHNDMEEQRMSVTNLTSDQFESVYSALNLVKEHALDCDISGGLVRQMVDKRDAVFEIFLTDCIGELDLPLITIKQKLELLKMFVGSEVTIESTDTNFSIVDSYSKFVFVKPTMNYINIPFMGEEDFAERFNFARSTLLVDTPISEKITERMRIIATNFNCLVFFIEFSGETCKIFAKAESGDQSIDIIRDIPLNEAIDESICNISTTQLIVEHDGELQLQLYHDSETDIILNKTQGIIKSIPYNIYSRTKFLEADADFS